MKAMMQSLKTGEWITLEEFDRRFDDGEDISEFVDFDSAYRPGTRLPNEPYENITVPKWVSDGPGAEEGEWVISYPVSKRGETMRWVKDQCRLYGRELDSWPEPRPASEPKVREHVMA